MKRIKPTIAVTAVAMVALAACGGGSSDSSGGGDTGSGPTQDFTGGNAGGTSDENAQGPAPAIDGATPGGDVIVNSAVAPSTLDPTRAYYTDSTAILSDLVTRSLTQYVYRDGEMVLIPDMATNLGTPNDDLTQWTFELKDGLKYEDGTEVTADDVAYAIKRSFAINELPDGPTYNTQFFLDGDKYQGPFKDGDKYRGVEVDGNKVIIKMRRPFGDMPYLASFPSYTGIPEAKDTDPTAYGDHPMATGPYKFEDYKPGSKLSLVRNEFWDPDTDPGRYGYPDTWTFNFAQDSTKIDSVLINDNGEAQTSLTYDAIQGPSYRDAQDAGIIDTRLTTGTSPCTYMWYIDMRKVKELEVRQALGWAYPYQAAWKVGGSIEGLTRLPGTTILPPGTAGRVEYVSLPGQDGRTTDPAKANALLKKAGYADGEYEIKFLYAQNDDASVKAKDEIVKSLEASGFKATPIASTIETIRDDRTNADSPINVRYTGWCSDWPSGGSWFPAQWSGDLVGVEGMPNPAAFKEADVDAEMNRILDTETGDDAAKAWGELDKLIETKYYPAVILGYDATASLHGSKIGGMEADNVRGIPTFAQIYVIQ